MTTQAAAARNPLVKYNEEEVIVGKQHEPMVLGILQEFGIECVVLDSSDLLGLAKLKIRSIDQARDILIPAEGLSALGRDEEEKAALVRWVAEYPPAKSRPSVDQVLWALRGVFSARFSGWSPTLGKNRSVGQVHGAGEVIHGGGGDPVALDDGFPFKDRTDAPGQGVRVGVLDTAVSPHPWLAGGWTARFSDTVTDPAPPRFAQGHATFVTGLILRQAPGATVEVRKVLSDDGQAESWDVAKEIVEFGRTGLDVLNLSFACYTEDGQPPMVLSVAMDRLDPDLVVVAAAGNHGLADQQNDVYNRADTRKAAWPAALDDVISVGATDEKDVRADFSPDACWVDVVTRGVLVPSTYLLEATNDHGEPLRFTDGYARWSGTSFAAALVTGAIAASTRPGHTSAREAARKVFESLKRYPLSETQDPWGPAPLFLPPPSFS